MAESNRGGGRAPDFFLVGQPKGGTSAMYEMLRGHPQIFMPDRKEPWFLASDMRPRFQPPMAGRLPETLEEYLALFSAASPGQLVGEASTSYILSSTAAEAISELRPDARIIAIFREPASFLRSLHMQLLQTHVEDQRELRNALALEADRREGRNVPRRSHRPQLLRYSEHVRYVEQLRRYDARFPKEQMLVLIYDDFRADNEGVVRQVLRFLGADDAAPIETLDANPTVLMRSQQLDELVHAVSTGSTPLGRAAKNTVKALTPRRLRREALRTAQRRIVHARPQPADDELMLEIRRRFKGEVEALGDYLGRDLVSLWGYDRLG